MNANDALARFLASRKLRCVPRIVAWYESHLTLFLRWLEGEDVREIETVTESHLRRFIESLRNRDRLTRQGKLSPVTIRMRVSAMRTFFGWLVSEGLLTTNPATRIQALLPRANHRLPKALNPNIVRKLMGAIMDRRERALVSLMLDTGLRLSEVSGLDLADLDLVRGMARVRHGKGDKERWVVFAETTQAHLESWLRLRSQGADEPALFIGPQGRLRPTGVYQVIKRLARRAGLGTMIHPHALRHTFATEYLNAGGQLVDLKELMGHSHIETTMIYVSVSLERVRRQHARLSLMNRLRSRGRRRI